MADFILHALFHREAGIQLWIEQVAGHRVVLPAQVPAGEFPPAITELLATTHFRHTQRVTLRTPKGREAKLTIPVAALTPTEALTYLATVDALAGTHPPVAADLVWLARLYAGVRQFVRAGRVIPRVKWIDGAWYPQWELVSQLAITTWLAQMQQAAPGVLIVNAGGQLVADAAEYLAHWTASAQLTGVLDGDAGTVWHPFVRALVSSSPVRRVSPTVISALNEWKTTVTAARVRMVLVVEEPTELPDFPRWVIRSQVVVDDQPPQPIRRELVDPKLYAQLRDIHDTAVGVSALLDPQLHSFRDIDVAEDGSTASFAERRGDFDVSLSDEEFLDFIEHAVDKLTKKSIEVLLPVGLARAGVHASVAADPNPPTGPSKVGLDQLISFDWTVSVGDTELTSAQMEELVTSASRLIKIRDRWVHVDAASLTRVRQYMEQLSKDTVAELTRQLTSVGEELTSAQRRGDADELARLTDLQARLEQELAAATEADHVPTVTSLRSLRALALTAAEDELLSFAGARWVSALTSGTSELPPPQPVPIPATVHANLRDYQRRGADWLVWMSEQGLGAVLADDMGLGKTLQLLTLLAVEHERRTEVPPTLVVAPTSVVTNWRREAERYVPSLRVLLYHGSSRPHGEELVKRVAASDLVITSYGTFSRDFAELQTIQWDHLVLDEAQAIKNTATAAAAAARIVPARQKIALTGTPVENHLTEFRAILDYANPGILGSAAWFRAHFAAPIERDRDSELAAKFRELTAPFVLRRLKTDPHIIDDLPSKEETVVPVELTGEQAALYTSYVRQVEQMLAEAKQGDMHYRGLVLKSLTKLKQICNHPAQFLGDGSGITRRGQHRSGKMAQLEKIYSNGQDNLIRVNCQKILKRI